MFTPSHGWLSATGVQQFWRRPLKVSSREFPSPEGFMVTSFAGVSAALDQELLKAGLWATNGLNRKLFEQGDVPKIAAIARDLQGVPVSISMLIHPTWSVHHYGPGRATVGLLSFFSHPDSRNMGVGTACMSALADLLLHAFPDPRKLGDYSVAASPRIMLTARMRMPISVVAQLRSDDTKPSYVGQVAANVVRHEMLAGRDPVARMRGEITYISHLDTQMQPDRVAPSASM
jgi:GNAT superfamily N-acetyltransferase